MRSLFFLAGNYGARRSSLMSIKITTTAAEETKLLLFLVPHLFLLMMMMMMMMVTTTTFVNADQVFTDHRVLNLSSGAFTDPRTNVTEYRIPCDACVHVLQSGESFKMGCLMNPGSSSAGDPIGFIQANCDSSCDYCTNKTIHFSLRSVIRDFYLDLGTTTPTPAGRKERQPTQMAPIGISCGSFQQSSVPGPYYGNMTNATFVEFVTKNTFEQLVFPPTTAASQKIPVCGDIICCIPDDDDPLDAVFSSRTVVIVLLLASGLLLIFLLGFCTWKMMGPCCQQKKASPAPLGSSSSSRPPVVTLPATTNSSPDPSLEKEEELGSVISTSGDSTLRESFRGDPEGNYQELQICSMPTEY